MVEDAHAIRIRKHLHIEDVCTMTRIDNRAAHKWVVTVQVGVRIHAPESHSCIVPTRQEQAPVLRPGQRVHTTGGQVISYTKV